jgi:hypothetical protein
MSEITNLLICIIFILVINGICGWWIFDEIRHLKVKDLKNDPQIIRCKDCKWFGTIGCAISIMDDSDKPSEDDFCSFAERWGDEE